MGVAFMAFGMSIVLMAFIYIKMAKSSFAKITIDSKGLAYFSGMNKIDWPWSEICDLNKTVFYRNVHNVNSREWKTSLRNKRLNKTGLPTSVWVK